MVQLDYFLVTLKLSVNKMRVHVIWDLISKKQVTWLFYKKNAAWGNGSFYYYYDCLKVHTVEINSSGSLNLKADLTTNYQERMQRNREAKWLA